MSIDEAYLPLLIKRIVAMRTSPRSDDRGSAPEASSPRQDDASVVSANVLTFGEVDGFLTRYLSLPASGQDPNLPYPGLGYAARIETETIGLVIFFLYASVIQDENLCFLFGAVDPSHRRRGVGARLATEAISAARRAVARPVFLVTLPERDPEPAAALLSRLQFEEIDRQIHFERKLRGADRNSDATGFDVRVYGGGDSSLDTVIMDLHRRAYRNRQGTPDLTINLLAQRLASHCQYVLLYAGERLIGYSSLWPDRDDCFADCIAVDRRYWRSGASDALASAVLRTASELGCAKISADATSSDRPACNMLVRHGLRQVKVTRRFRLGPPAGA